MNLLNTLITDVCIRFFSTMDNLFDINVSLIVIVASISTITITIASYVALRLMLEKPPARFHAQVPPGNPETLILQTIAAYCICTLLIFFC